MRREIRTALQIAANEMDLDVFRLANNIDRFANEYRLEDAREMAMIIDGMRHRIRQHMHRKDREATS